MKDFLLRPHDVVVLAEWKMAFITLVAEQSHVILKMTRIKINSLKLFLLFYNKFFLPGRSKCNSHQGTSDTRCTEKRNSEVVTLIDPPWQYLEAGGVPGEVGGHAEDELVVDGALAAHAQRRRELHACKHSHETRGKWNFSDTIIVSGSCLHVELSSRDILHHWYFTPNHFHPPSQVWAPAHSLTPL